MPIPSAQVVAERWHRRAAAAATDYAAGIQAVTENPLDKAAAAGHLWQERVASPAALAKFQRKLRAFSFEAWKNAAATHGQSRYSQGVANKQAQYEQAIAPVLQYEAQLQQRIQAMPKATIEDRVQRAAAWIRGMAQYRGQG